MHILATAIDRDDDNWVSYMEAVQFVDNIIIEELKEGYRSMTTMLNCSSSVSKQTFWTKWSTSIGLFNYLRYIIIREFNYLRSYHFSFYNVKYKV